MKPYAVGDRVRTLRGEADTDENGDQRHTEVGSVGRIIAFNHFTEEHGNIFDVIFPNGCWVVLSDRELNDSNLYEVQPVTTLKVIHDEVAPLIERDENLTARQRRRLVIAVCFWRNRHEVEAKAMKDHHLLDELEAAIADCITDRLVA